MNIGLKIFTIMLGVSIGLTSCTWLQQPPAPIKQGMTIEKPPAGHLLNAPAQTIPLESDTLPTEASQETL